MIKSINISGLRSNSKITVNQDLFYQNSIVLIDENNEEIKEFIVSKNDMEDSEQNKTDYFNNYDEDTLILTKIVDKEDKFDNNNPFEAKDSDS